MLGINERRKFIRHPICYPLEFEYAPRSIVDRTNTINISEGGLLFLSKQAVPAGDIIVINLTFQDKLFRVKARVVHANKDRDNPNLYDIGVAFYKHEDAFKVKLIEQIYLIDEYRALRSVQLGRDVDFKEASDDWIKKYSDRFDQLFWGKKTQKKGSADDYM